MTAATGERIKALRVAYGLSQRDLAALCGVSFPHISKVERGRERPSLDLLAKIHTNTGRTDGKAGLRHLIENSGRCLACGSVPKDHDGRLSAVLGRSEVDGVQVWAAEGYETEKLETNGGWPCVPADPSSIDEE